MPVRVVLERGPKAKKFAVGRSGLSPMDAAELERKLTLLQAGRACFGDVAARVSPQMRKRPPVGGCERDTIIAHTVRVDREDFARKVGLAVPERGALAPGAPPVRIPRGDARLPA
jgi:hypothetical protein